MSATTVLGSTLADRYRIERQIGVGGMATVYLARDLKHDRRVALKVLKPDIAAVLGVERFLSEIRVTAQLQHPNLLPLFDSGEAGGMLYYVMPYVEGESLRERLLREKQLRLDEALHIATSVASALEYAHSQGVIHRDLKPENILMQSGEPVVADFGIALAVSKAGGERVTQTGVSLGTPHYMSPEQATGDRQIDGRTDIYALGAVLYEMLSGEPPHTGGSVQAIFARIIADRPQSIQLIRPSVPDSVVYAVERALEKLPADRWATARDFAAALQERMPGQYVSRRVPRSAQRPWMRRMVGASVAGVAVAVLGLGVWGWVLALERGRSNVVAFRMSLAPDERISVGGSPLAISPDGKSILYVARVGNNQQLFMRRLDEVRAQPLAGTTQGSRPVFSPDGRWIAFVSQGRIKRVPLSGGPPLEMSSSRIFSAFAWSPGGQFVVALQRGPKTPPVLGTIPATGGTAVPLTTLDSAAGEQSHRWPTVLADGETILYTSYPKGGARDARIAIASLSTGRSTILDLPGVRALGVIDDNLVYVGEDGTIRAVSVDLRGRRATGAPVPLLEGLRVAGGGFVSAALSASGTLVYLAGTNDAHLVTVDRNGASRLLHPDVQAFNTPRVSPDGRRLALAIGKGNAGDIWIYDLATTTLSRLTNDSSAWYPEWSADGRYVFYTRGRDKDVTIHAKPIDGSGPPAPIIADGKFHYFTLHPNGRTILYTTFPDSGQGSLWTREISGDSTQRPLSGSGGGEWTYRVSPDGRWLAYQSFESGTDQVYVRPFPGPGARVQVSTTYGTEPVWSRDGRRLHYRDGQKVMMAMLQLSPSLEVVGRQTLFDDTFDQWWDVAAYDVTRDDRFVMVRQPQENQHVVVITNWRDQLRSRLRERR